ncbi:MAG: glycoside hydrolase family 9 protein [Candidatus Marinimicrobia bacterium]|nr:glycoside hydrolase family 9 protein [Candidatus Neomarinimicrobiota bacterium]
MNFKKWSPGIIFLYIVSCKGFANESAVIRINQIGYLSDEAKTAVILSEKKLDGKNIEIIVPESDAVVLRSELTSSEGSWGEFEYCYRFDFSALNRPGKYRIRISKLKTLSREFNISSDVYDGYAESILEYIRQQRCGYNPFTDEVCHKKDGRTMYGPMPDSTYIDVSGGWHDAGDHLRYMLTSGNTICRMLFAYLEHKDIFVDNFNALGQPGANGVADILDEIRWGLDWMLKMHPAQDQLFHQVADDRDHVGFKLPHLDTADYGWGPGSYRVVYYATGKPQGLFKYQNTSTGIANLAGRYAAAMAMAYRVWKEDLKDVGFANRCLKAGREVYEMGLRQPGCQEGTPCRSPYRYSENTWADDMEWGAAELYKVTQNSKYLHDAKDFAKLINTNSWMGRDTADHYECYPFMNMGHYALFEVTDKAFRDTLIGYYKAQIEVVKARADRNPFKIGIPFIWCSNNLAAAFITQCLLYEKMTGDIQYRKLMAAHRDWLLGNNPWGVSQFVGIPKDGVTPLHPHTPMIPHLNRLPIGGLNDGPVYASIYNNLKGIRLYEEDEYARFQSDYVVFHDDLGDYSTNEPTLDGTAEAIYFFSVLSSK